MSLIYFDVLNIDVLINNCQIITSKIMSLAIREPMLIEIKCSYDIGWLLDRNSRAVDEIYQNTLVEIAGTLIGYTMSYNAPLTGVNSIVDFEDIYLPYTETRVPKKTIRTAGLVYWASQLGLLLGTPSVIKPKEIKQRPLAGWNF